MKRKMDGETNENISFFRESERVDRKMDWLTDKYILNFSLLLQKYTLR